MPLNTACLLEDFIIKALYYTIEQFMESNLAGVAEVTITLQPQGEMLHPAGKKFLPVSRLSTS